VHAGTRPSSSAAPTSPAYPATDEDYDVFDGEREVGRIYLVDSNAGNETWFWGVSYDLTHRKSYGHATSLDAAKAAFRAEYGAWRAANGRLPVTQLAGKF
jgi:hypothetical protein